MSFPVVFHTENCAVHSENSTFSSVYLQTPRWHHLKAHPFPAIHSADEHRMIYSFSNATSYSTFYAFFSSFRITLWPTWLANSKRKPFFLSTIDTRTRRHTELTQLTNLMGNLCCAGEYSVQFFVKFFFFFLHSETAQFNLECVGPFRVYGALHGLCI